MYARELNVCGKNIENNFLNYFVEYYIVNDNDF